MLSFPTIVKISRFTIIFIALCILFLSCSDLNVRDDDSLNKFRASITLKETSKDVSVELAKIGVIEVKVENESDELFYELVFNNEIKYYEKLHYLKNVIFVLKEDFLTVKNDERVKLRLKNEKILVETPSLTGIIDDINFEKLDNESSKNLKILLLMLNEIRLDNSKRVNPTMIQKSLKVGPCENFHLVYSVNYTRELAENEVANAFMAVYKADGNCYIPCQTTTGIETSCLGDNHLCISTRGYCCDSASATSCY